jgi:predicted transcriptional regulator
MTKHLAIFSDKLAGKVLSGLKTVDFRFSDTKKAPFLKLSRNDLVYLKNVSEPIIGQTEVENVLYFENLKKTEIKSLIKRYCIFCGIDRKELEKYAGKYRYLSIIFFCHTRRFLSPVKIKKRDRRPWITDFKF